MQGKPGLAGRIFTAISREKVNIIAIAQGSSELTIAVVVRRDGLEKAVRAVHAECGMGRVRPPLSSVQAGAESVGVIPPRLSNWPGCRPWGKLQRDLQNSAESAKSTAPSRSRLSKGFCFNAGIMSRARKQAVLFCKYLYGIFHDLWDMLQLVQQSRPQV